MNSTKRIMVAFDLSEHSINALKHACGLAKDLEAELVIANVIHQRDVNAVEMVERVTSVKQEAAPGIRLTVDDYIDGLKAERTDAMDKVIRESSGEGLSIKKEFRVGIPFRELIDIAKDEQADLLVMGSKGRSNIAGILLGTTAEKMFRHCPVPLLSVRSPEDFGRNGH